MSITPCTILYGVKGAHWGKWPESTVGSRIQVHRNEAVSKANGVAPVLVCSVDCCEALVPQYLKRHGLSI